MILLHPDEPPALEIVRAEGTSPFFLTCDHASNRRPRAVGTMGLSDEELEDHIAWDIGAAHLARLLSERLDAPLVLSGYSRLVIDANRPFESPTSIPEVTCEVPVPGNVGLSDEEKAARREELFWPYHRAIERTLAERDARGRRSAIVAVHSFTPSLHGKARPWHFGVMYGRDRRLAAALLDALSEERGVVVGDNEPYRVTDGSDYGIPAHAERAGRLGVLLEVRQDRIATASGVQEMAEPLLRALDRVLAALGPW